MSTQTYCSFFALSVSFFVFHSTLKTVLLKAWNVSPFLARILDSQPSGIRSSIKNDSRSLTLPPIIVSIVEELYFSQRALRVETIVNTTYLELPNNLCPKSNENSGLALAASMRRFAEKRARSSGVRRAEPSGAFPEEDSRSSLT